MEVYFYIMEYLKREIIIEKDLSVWGNEVTAHSKETYLMFDRYTEEPIYEDVVTTDEEGNEITTKVKVFDCKGYIDNMVANGWVLIDKRNSEQEENDDTTDKIEIEPGLEP